MELEDLKVYGKAMGFGEKIWELVNDWSYFQKDTIGKQLIRSADSVAANLSEGFGRYHFGEKKHFGYYSRGSLYESKTWLKKAANRNLISDKQFVNFEQEIVTIGKMLNSYIKSIGDASRSNQ